MTETCHRPCPPWCELTPGHPWETEYEGRLERHHEMACDPEGFTRLGVAVTVRESATATDDGDDVIGPSTFDTPTVCGMLDDPLTGHMTPAQARALARALDAAAITAERLTGRPPAGNKTTAPTMSATPPVTPTTPCAPGQEHHA